MAVLSPGEIWAKNAGELVNLMIEVIGTSKDDKDKIKAACDLFHSRWENAKGGSFERILFFHLTNYCVALGYDSGVFSRGKETGTKA